MRINPISFGCDCKCQPKQDFVRVGNLSFVDRNQVFAITHDSNSNDTIVISKGGAVVHSINHENRNDIYDVARKIMKTDSLPPKEN